MDRRKFLASAGAFAASVTAGGARAAIGTNDKIGLAAIGVRNMGWADLSSAMATNGAQLVAIADVDKTSSKGAERRRQKSSAQSPLSIRTTARFWRGKTSTP